MKKLFSALLLIIGSSSLVSYEIVPDESGLEILSPKLERRKTLKLRLDNGLQAYLISDPTSKESGAALSVETGSFDDPKGRPGLAHFTEHMLFAGNAKYPEENDFHAFNAAHGGCQNAFTTDYRTVYIFSVENSAFSPSLDRFASFFVSPLFTPKALQHESHAVDEEFSKDLSSDTWRILHVKKELANPEHPFRTFSIGNQSTLGDTSHDEILQWYESHYSANLMHLVVYSAESIEQMKEEVVAAFSAIPNRNLVRKSYPVNLFDKTSEGKITLIAPAREIQRLEMIFELPKSDKDDKSEELIAQVLSYEGQNSLLSDLKQKGLVEDLYCCTESLGLDQKVLTLNLGLTEEGVKHYNQVIERTFAGIDSLQSSELPPAFFQDLQKAKKIQYAYQEKGELFRLLSDLAFHLPEEPLASFPQLSVFPKTFEPEKIQALFNQINYQKGRYFLIASPSQLPSNLDKTECWMGTKYSVMNLELELINHLKNPTTLSHVQPPQGNPFIPQNLNLVGQIQANPSLLPPPELLVETPASKVFYAKDDRFLIPEVAFRFSIKTPQIREADPQSCVLSDLFIKVASDRLREMAFDAKLAGLTYDLSCPHGELLLSLNGFSDKAELFLNTIVEKIQDLRPSSEEFSLQKEILARDYENEANESPLAQAKDLMKNILYKNYNGAAGKKRVLRRVNFEEFQRFSQTVFKEAYVEATLMGNLEKEDASKIASHVTAKLAPVAFNPKLHPQVELANLPEQPSFLSQKSKLPGHALILTIDAVPFALKKEVIADILSQGIQEPLFNELRSQQRTAYLVSNRSAALQKHLYLFFFIQSASHEPRDLLSRFELFIEELVHDFRQAFPENKFQTIKDAAIANLSEKAKSLSDMATLLHTIGFENDANFALLDEKKAIYSSLTYDEFEKEAKLLLGSDNQRRLGCGIFGTIPEFRGIAYQAPTSQNKLRKEIEYTGRGILNP